MVILSLLVSLISGLITTIITWLVDGANGVAIALCNSDLTSFSTSGNLLTIFEKLFTDNNLKFGVNIAQLFMVVAYVGIILFTMFELLNSMIAGLQGEKAENPLKVLARGVVTIFLELLIFGNPFGKAGVLSDTGSWFNVGTNGQGSLIATFGALMSQLLNLLYGTGATMSYSGLGKFTATNDMPMLIILIILQISLFKNIVQAAIVFVERYLTFAIYILIGPVAVATNASTKTKTSFHDWLVGIISQFLAIFVCLMAFRMYISCWSAKGQAVLQSVFDIKKGFPVDVLLHYCICLALVGLVSNSEKIVNALGFKTIATGDTARAFATGARSVGMAWRMTGGRALAGLARTGVGNLAHINSANFKRMSAGVSNSKFGQTRFGQMVSGGMNAVDKLNTALDPHRFDSVNRDSNFNMFGKHAQKTDWGNFEYTGKNANLQANTKYTNDKIGTYGNVKIGNQIDMNPLTQVSGLSDNTNFSTKGTGVVVQDTQNNPGVLFRGQWKDHDGSLHEDTFMMSASSTLEAGNKIMSDANGSLGYEIGKDGAYATLSSGYTLYRVDESSTISANDFSALPEDIQRNFDYGRDSESAKEYNRSVYESQGNVDAVIEQGEYKASIQRDPSYVEAQEARELENAMFEQNDDERYREHLKDIYEYEGFDKEGNYHNYARDVDNDFLNSTDAHAGNYDNYRNSFKNADKQEWLNGDPSSSSKKKVTTIGDDEADAQQKDM